ncbi:MAG: tRNA (adenosine(37)-N6)-threonylcarbamoyltransferase complex ATPase subunit type 1 TsaE [Pseudomonadota bacterium]
MSGSIQSRDFEIAHEGEMTALGADIAAVLSLGDQIGLVGELGAGKTTLARAILRRLAEDPTLEVPSPTFTLVQRYDEGRLPVRHADLYRISDPQEAEELGLGEPDAADLVEWPLTTLPITLEITFGADGAQARRIKLSAPESFALRLDRRRALARFVARTAFSEATERHLSGDASTRAYLRFLRADGVGAVLMDAPSFALPAGSYTHTARLADGNNRAFLAVGAALAARGLSAPKVHAADPDAGFLLLEDLGDEKIAKDGAPVAARYLRAAEALAAFHEAPLSLPLDDTVGGQFVPPTFDAALGAFEAGLYPQWLMQADPPADYTALWRAAIDALSRQDDRLALRDYHSPNCLWLEEREGVAQVGMIDYQDAMIAPAAYDVVSLAQDARVPIPPALEDAILARYTASRSTLDMDAFREAYHVLGAQRAARIAGVFRRLNDRDGKGAYLAHIPRMLETLQRNLCATPTLAALREWYAAHPPTVAP